jgi:hypothetical protein
MQDEPGLLSLCYVTDYELKDRGQVPGLLSLCYVTDYELKDRGQVPDRVSSHKGAKTNDQ